MRMTLERRPVLYAVLAAQLAIIVVLVFGISWAVSRRSGVSKGGPASKAEPIEVQARKLAAKKWKEMPSADREELRRQGRLIFPHASKADLDAQAREGFFYDEAMEELQAERREAEQKASAESRGRKAPDSTHQQNETVLAYLSSRQPRDGIMSFVLCRMREDTKLRSLVDGIDDLDDPRLVTEANRLASQFIASYGAWRGGRDDLQQECHDSVKKCIGQRAFAKEWGRMSRGDFSK